MKKKTNLGSNPPNQELQPLGQTNTQTGIATTIWIGLGEDSVKIYCALLNISKFEAQFSVQVVKYISKIWITVRSLNRSLQKQKMVNFAFLLSKPSSSITTYT